MSPGPNILIYVYSYTLTVCHSHRSHNGIAPGNGDQQQRQRTACHGRSRKAVRVRIYLHAGFIMASRIGIPDRHKQRIFIVGEGADDAAQRIEQQRRGQQENVPGGQRTEVLAEGLDTTSMATAHFLRNPHLSRSHLGEHTNTVHAGQNASDDKEDGDETV